MSLSLAMIVKDEAETLDGMLTDAAAFCDELVVVDTGSTDRTRDIARAAGATVLDVDWVDKFAAARHSSFAACTSATSVSALGLSQRAPAISCAASLLSSSATWL